MAKSTGNAPLTPAVLHILLALSTKERHGYGIMKQVRSESQGKVTMGPGTLYGSIGRMIEAELIREILLVMGVPRDAIVLEPRNRVTLDNRRYTSGRLAQMGVDSVLLVTSAFHMRRAMLVFSPLDLNVFPAPSDFQVLRGNGSATAGDYLPSVKALQRTTWAFHEKVGYWYYKLRG